MTQIRPANHIGAPWAGIVDSPNLEMAFSLGLIALIGLTHFIRDRELRMPAFVEERAWVRWVIYLLLALAIMNLGVSREIPFIYAQF
jgi:hypothetical protein